MDGTTFGERMSGIDSAFQKDELEQALRDARALVANLEAEEIIDASQLGWAIFYELKALHGQEDWQGYADIMEGKGVFLAGIGAKNHAFACSLMMESLYRASLAEDIPKWGAECCLLRIHHDDFDSLNMAITTARNLLMDLERADLEIDFLERLIDVGAQTEVSELSVHAQRWALEAADADAELLAQVRKRCMARLDQWKALATDATSGVIAFLSEIALEEWFLSLLSPEERKRQEQAAKLFDLARAGDVAALLALVDEAGDSNLCDILGRTALGIAAFADDAKLVDAFLKRDDIIVDHVNLQKRTALAQAADQGHTDIVGKLLAAGASPDIADLNEQTPLILASWQDHVDCVKLLLAAGASLDMLDKTGNNALTLAATEDVPDVIVALLDGGANINASTALGHTALMKAAMEGQTKNVEILLARGADRSAKDQYGMTAEDWAKQEGHDMTAKFLINQLLSN